MDTLFLEAQKNKAVLYLEKLGDTDSDEKNKVAIVSQYISSLLEPGTFTDAEREDIRKLALELGYEAEIDFDAWLKTLTA